jgi:HEXXH motif-containing protein
MVAVFPSPKHVVAPNVFASLTRGRGDAADVHRFAGTERSWRLVGLHHLISALRDDPAPGGHHRTGPLDPIDAAWEIIAAAEAADEEIANEVLMYPQAGIWVAHLLRRLREVVADEWPLWTDVGYLHGLAAAAAIRTGIDFSVRVPLRSGAVVLPTVGMARFPGAGAGVAEVRRAGGEVVVAADGRVVRPVPDDPSWRAAPLCTAEHDGARISFLIDDVDPYRDLRG